MLSTRRPFGTLGRRNVSWDGSTIGRFRIDGVLGRGGMGVVYRAYDPQLERPVAIKLLTERTPSVANGTTVNLRESFDHDGLLDEARALAQIADPNVLAVHEIGSDSDQSFLVMELVEGEDVRQWLAAAPRSLAEIYGVFAQAGRGLAAAHRRGVIHRDFKPENVLISSDGRVRVCDFGIAAFARSRELIRAGRVGTPRYMAPELWGDRAASVSSDVYAFAVSLVEAICGEVASDAEKAGAELAKRGVDARVRDVLVRALAADPTRRPDSIDEITRTFTNRSRRRWPLVAAGGAAIAASLVVVVLARGDDAATCESAQTLLDARWAARDRDAVRSAVIAVGGRAEDAVAIVERLDRYGTLWVRLRDETCTIADAPRRAARLSCLDRRLFELGSVARALREPPTLELAKGRSNSLVDLGACIEATEVRMPSDPTKRAKIEALTARVTSLYDRGLAVLGSEGDQAAFEQARAESIELGDTELAIRIDRIRAQLAGNAGKLEVAEQILDAAYALAAQHRYDSTAGLVLVEAARLASLRDKTDVAKSKLAVARVHLERSPDATPYSRLTLYRALATNAAARGAFAEAHAAFDAAKTALAAMDPRDPLWDAMLDVERVRLLEREGKLAGARELAGSAETALRALGKQGVPELGELLALVARIEHQLGNRALAIAAQHDRLAVLEKHMPETDAGRVSAEGQIGLALLDTGAFEEARETFTRTLERTKRIEALATFTADYHNYLARTERLLRNYDRARTHLEHALADVRARSGPNDPAIGFHEITYALVELEAGQLQRAAAHLALADATLAALPAEHVNRLDFADTQIAVALAAQRPEDAEAIATRTLELLAERRIDDARVERFWLGTATARNARGDYTGARELAERTLTRRRARNADPIELAQAEIEIVKARIGLGDASAAAELRALAKQLDAPVYRVEHALLLRWMRARRL